MTRVTKIKHGAAVLHAVDMSSERIRPCDVVKLVKS